MFTQTRADARFCSVRCRVATHRQLSVTTELSVTPPLAELSVTVSETDFPNRQSRRRQKRLQSHKTISRLWRLNCALMRPRRNQPIRKSDEPKLPLRWNAGVQSAGLRAVTAPPRAET
jgi:hypothetical protein